MDDFSCSGEVLHQTLRELERINKLLGGDQISVHGLKQLIRRNQQEKYDLVDLGCGGGDTLKLMDRWAQKRNHRVQFMGIDANANIIDYARANTSGNNNISFEALDIFSESFKGQQYDIAHCSLFAHHFTDDELIALLQQLTEQARLGIIINDLHRHTISYYFTKWVIRTLSKSEMVRFDSVVSVARSFRRKELVNILNRANIKNYTLKWRWAFRWELIIYH